jgi:hypothetical protein
LIRNATNAAQSMICRGNPMPFFVTDASDWLYQRKSRKRQRYVQGVLHRDQSQLMGQGMAQQGCIFGTGYIWCRRTRQGPRLQRVFSPQVLVDEFEGLYGEPPNFYICETVDRGELIASFPELEDEIRKAPKAEVGGSTGDQVDVFYAWHMAAPGYNPKKDKGNGVGTEAIAISTGAQTGRVLMRRDYKWKHWPGIEWRWNPEPIGYHGSGIPAEGAQTQFDVNAALLLVQKNLMTGGNLKVMTEKSTQILDSQLTNTVGTRINYVGAPPVFSVPQTIDGAVMGYIEFMAQQFYQNLGIPELYAQGENPGASMSGKSRLVQNQNESRRFVTTQRRYDHAMSIDIAERILESAEDCQDEYGDSEVMYAGLRTMEPVSYKDVIGPRDSFDIQCFSASGLSNTPAGRYEEVQTFVAAGYYSPDEAQILMDLPSTGAMADDKRATLENIELRLAKIMDEGVFIPPDDGLPLEWALKRANMQVNRAEVMYYNNNPKRRIPEDNLRMLREWRDMVIDLIALGQQPAASPAVAPPMDPALGAPMAGMVAGAPAAGAPGLAA